MQAIVPARGADPGRNKAAGNDTLRAPLTLVRVCRRRNVPRDKPPLDFLT
jgi:hypothetical protein